MPTEADIKMMFETMRDDLTKLNESNTNIVLVYPMACDVFASTPMMIKLMRKYMLEHF
jgi:hypothetical protein